MPKFKDVNEKQDLFKMYQIHSPMEKKIEIWANFAPPQWDLQNTGEISSVGTPTLKLGMIRLKSKEW